MSKDQQKEIIHSIVGLLNLFINVYDEQTEFLKERACALQKELETEKEFKFYAERKMNYLKMQVSYLQDQILIFLMHMNDEEISKASKKIDDLKAKYPDIENSKKESENAW